MEYRDQNHTPVIHEAVASKSKIKYVPLLLVLFGFIIVANIVLFQKNIIKTEEITHLKKNHKAELADVMKQSGIQKEGKPTAIITNQTKRKDRETIENHPKSQKINKTKTQRKTQVNAQSEDSTINPITKPVSLIEIHENRPSISNENSNLRRALITESQKSEFVPIHNNIQLPVSPLEREYNRTLVVDKTELSFADKFSLVTVQKFRKPLSMEGYTGIYRIAHSKLKNNGAIAFGLSVHIPISEHGKITTYADYQRTSYSAESALTEIGLRSLDSPKPNQELSEISLLSQSINAGIGMLYQNLLTRKLGYYIGSSFGISKDIHKELNYEFEGESEGENDDNVSTSEALDFYPFIHRSELGLLLSLSSDLDIKLGCNYQHQILKKENGLPAQYGLKVGLNKTL